MSYKDDSVKEFYDSAKRRQGGGENAQPTGETAAETTTAVMLSQNRLIRFFQVWGTPDKKGTKLGVTTLNLVATYAIFTWSFARAIGIPGPVAFYYGMASAMIFLFFVTRWLQGKTDLEPIAKLQKGMVGGIIIMLFISLALYALFPTVPLTGLEKTYYNNKVQKNDIEYKIADLEYRKHEKENEAILNSKSDDPKVMGKRLEALKKGIAIVEKGMEAGKRKHDWQIHLEDREMEQHGNNLYLGIKKGKKAWLKNKQQKQTQIAPKTAEQVLQESVAKYSAMGHNIKKAELNDGGQWEPGGFVKKGQRINYLSLHKFQKKTKRSVGAWKASVNKKYGYRFTSKNDEGPFFFKKLHQDTVVYYWITEG